MKANELIPSPKQYRLFRAAGLLTGADDRDEEDYQDTEELYSVMKIRGENLLKHMKEWSPYYKMCGLRELRDTLLTYAVTNKDLNLRMLTDLIHIVPSERKVYNCSSQERKW